MKQVVLTFPLVGFALRVELVPVVRRPAENRAIIPVRKVLRREDLSVRLLQDIGLDDGRRD
jgi:hypothetical protein